MHASGTTIVKLESMGKYYYKQEERAGHWQGALLRSRASIPRAEEK